MLLFKLVRYQALEGNLVQSLISIYQSETATIVTFSKCFLMRALVSCSISVRSYFFLNWTAFGNQGTGHLNHSLYHFVYILRSVSLK